MGIFIISPFLGLMGWGVGESQAAEGKYPNRVVQVVICYQPGSTDVILGPFTDQVWRLFHPISSQEHSDLLPFLKRRDKKNFFMSLPSPGWVIQ